MTSYKNPLAHQRDPATVTTLLDDAAGRGKRYRLTIDERRVGPSAEALGGLRAFDESLPDEPTDPMESIAMLDDIGSPATMGMAGPRFFGFVIGASLPVTVAANWLATSWDQNTGLYLATPVTSKLEEVALQWLIDLFDFPESTGCAFVTGATMANFTCLAAARHEVLREVGWDAEEKGLFSAPPITVVIGEEAHPTLIKALGLLGMGRSRVITVPVDSQGRMLPDALPDVQPPSIICIQAGNVNTGAFDSASLIVPRARDMGSWVHVDAAFGLWAEVSSAYRHLTESVAQADSWATDAHKWLNVPYDSGIAFVRESDALRQAMSLSAAYLPMTGHREPSQFTPELSRRARGVEIWAALRSLGRKGLAEMIESACRNARRFADGLSRHGYEILNEVVLNQVLVSFGPPELTNRIIQRIQEDGTCWCGGTVWQGKTAMRISVSSWSTTHDDIDRSLDAILRIASAESET